MNQTKIEIGDCNILLQMYLIYVQMNVKNKESKCWRNKLKYKILLSAEEFKQKRV